MSREELENKLAVLLGGRAAETIVFEDISTGAADDLSKATEIARSMAVRYGMVKAIGPITYDSEVQPCLNNYQPVYPEAKRYSEETSREIDCAVRDLVNKALDRALNILVERRHELETAAIMLLDKETLNQEDLLPFCPQTRDKTVKETEVLQTA